MPNAKFIEQHDCKLNNNLGKSFSSGRGPEPISVVSLSRGFCMEQRLTQTFAVMYLFILRRHNFESIENETQRIYAFDYWRTIRKKCQIALLLVCLIRLKRFAAWNASGNVERIQSVYRAVVFARQLPAFLLKFTFHLLSEQTSIGAQPKCQWSERLFVIFLISVLILLLFSPERPHCWISWGAHCSFSTCSRFVF